MKLQSKPIEIIEKKLNIHVLINNFTMESSFIKFKCTHQSQFELMLLSLDDHRHKYQNSHDNNSMSGMSDPVTWSE